jgi:ethanolamine utilization protein EutA
MSPPQPTTGFFSGRNRTINAEDRIELVSVGIDIGSSTSHLVFSRIVMQRHGAIYRVSERESLFESPMRLTPYLAGADIDADALAEFVAAQYRSAGYAPDSIDTGALILTGVAAQRANARAIGEALAIDSGKFVAVSAGDLLETTLIAHGSGAVRQSTAGERIMAIDVGGGTSKIAICADGKIVERVVVDVGARLISFDADGRVVAVEAAGRRLAAECGIDARAGAVIASDARTLLAEHLAMRLFQAIGALPDDGLLASWLRTNAAVKNPRVDRLIFSGGVAEYLYQRETAEFGDLGPELAAALARHAAAWGIPAGEPTERIRATVIAASQYTVQLSGSTIFVWPESALPLRNVIALRPELQLDTDTIDAAAVRAAVAHGLEGLDGSALAGPVALCIEWHGPASYARLDALCRGIAAAVRASFGADAPLIVVTDGDVGGLIGMHLHEECGVAGAVVSIDGIALGDLDFIDIGALIEASGAVPVVVKSLLFGVSS